MSIEIAYQPLNPKEIQDLEKKAGRPLATDDEVYQFILEEREYAMKEQLFDGRTKRPEKV